MNAFFGLLADDEQAAWKDAEAEADMLREQLRTAPAVDPRLLEPGMNVIDRRGHIGSVFNVGPEHVTVVDRGFAARWPFASVVAIQEVQL